MTLKEVSGPDDAGSLAVVYHCGGCEQETAMLTNAHETQLVSSLGVTIGPEGETESKCPFTKALREASGAGESTSSESGDAGDISWTPEAKARLDGIPEFVRPMAKMGIEKFAKEQGASTIDEGILDSAREFMGM